MVIRWERKRSRASLSIRKRDRTRDLSWRIASYEWPGMPTGVMVKSQPELRAISKSVSTQQHGFIGVDIHGSY